MQPNPSIRTGMFVTSSGKAILGELTVDGPNSSLLLHDSESILLDNDKLDLCIVGSLHDLTRVTLIHATVVERQHRRRPQEVLEGHTARLFPHFIVTGDFHLEPSKRSVRSISFTFPEIFVFFDDMDAFGCVIDSSPFIESLVKTKAELLERSIHTGPEPQIAYFTGQRLIIEVPTVLGTVAARHSPSWPTGGSRGVRIDNEISITITPETPVNFEDAVVHNLLPLIRFLTVALGRTPAIPTFSVEIDCEGKIPTHLEVHWSHHPRPRREQKGSRDSPHSYDLPFDPLRRPDEFNTVLAAWLARDPERRDARIRADAAYTLENFYSPDRLVGAANAFDLLPDDAVPKKTELSPAVTDAKYRCQAIVKELDDGDARDSLLGALGRLGQATLKQKVRHRARIVTAAVDPGYLTDLPFVCDRAIECRNHFVHGSPVQFDASRGATRQFLTDTLEFVFCVSELVEMGWNLSRLIKAGSSMSHPFGTYIITYAQNLHALHASLKSSRRP